MNTTQRRIGAEHELLLSPSPESYAQHDFSGQGLINFVDKPSRKQFIKFLSDFLENSQIHLRLAAMCVLSVIPVKTEIQSLNA